MKQKIILVLQLLFLFCVGAFAYSGHGTYVAWFYSLDDGCSGRYLFSLIIGALNEGYNWKIPFPKQVL